eukprot:5089409-Prymnesium_polylepis.1
MHQRVRRHEALRQAALEAADRHDVVVLVLRQQRRQLARCDHHLQLCVHALVVLRRGRFHLGSRTQEEHVGAQSIRLVDRELIDRRGAHNAGFRRRSHRSLAKMRASDDAYTF